jgi:hypothetical protein
MRKVLDLIFLLIFSMTIVACDKETTTTTDVDITTTDQGGSEIDVYQLLIEAEELSGMKDYDGILITESKDLGLPTEYNGVVITYKSRNSEIISDEGVVTLPDSCWIESREQDGVTPMPNLNDNWPIVLDVTMEYMGQVRTAKLMFIVAPAPGFSCDKYLG